MILDVEALRRGDPDAQALLYSQCREAARRGAARIGATGFVDDITQEMAMHVLTRFLDVYEPGRDVEPYLVKVGTMMGRTHQRRHSKEVLLGENSTNSDPWWDRADEDEGTTAEESIDMEEVERRAASAKEILVNRLREHRQKQAQRAERASPRSAGSASEARARRERWPAPASADALPFDAPIWKHMHHWCDVLGIDREAQPAWHIELGDLVSVHRATAYRWRQGLTQPSARLIATLDAMVEGIARAREQEKSGNGT